MSVYVKKGPKVWTQKDRAAHAQRMRQIWAKRRNQQPHETNLVAVLESKIEALVKQMQTLEQAKAILTGAN